jgi:Tol biopolymer transport system component
MRADGGERTPLGEALHPTFADWSPDGRAVAFDRSVPDGAGPAGVWVIGADGSSPRPVCGAVYPDWAPDGRSLLALQGRPDPEERFEFVRCDVTGAETPLPLRGLYDHSRPRLSPNGARLVYGAADGVWVAAADGAWARRILPNDLAAPRGGRPRAAAFGPSWHPDGRRVVYGHLRIDSYRDGPYGPVIRGQASLRLLDVEAALRASDL